jgi:hypothetical protein
LIACFGGEIKIEFEVSSGLKKWRAPWHLDEAHVLDRRIAHPYLVGDERGRVGRERDFG